jgi:DNA-binding transcriptional regulator LsrR (DeoR family)
MDGIDINERIIGVGLDDLRHVQHSFAIARGPAKIEAICGALRGRYLTALVTDDLTARGVIAHATESQMEIR